MAVRGGVQLGGVCTISMSRAPKKISKAVPLAAPNGLSLSLSLSLSVSLSLSLSLSFLEKGRFVPPEVNSWLSSGGARSRQIAGGRDPVPCDFDAR